MLGATCSTTESVKPEGRTWSNEEWCQQGESQVNGKENNNFYCKAGCLIEGNFCVIDSNNHPNIFAGNFWVTVIRLPVLDMSTLLSTSLIHL